MMPPATLPPPAAVSSSPSSFAAPPTTTPSYGASADAASGHGGGGSLTEMTNVSAGGTNTITNINSNSGGGNVTNQSAASYSVDTSFGGGGGGCADISGGVSGGGRQQSTHGNVVVVNSASLCSSATAYQQQYAGVVPTEKKKKRRQQQPQQQQPQQQQQQTGYGQPVQQLPPLQLQLQSQQQQQQPQHTSVDTRAFQQYPVMQQSQQVYSSPTQLSSPPPAYSPPPVSSQSAANRSRHSGPNSPIQTSYAQPSPITQSSPQIQQPPTPSNACAPAPKRRHGASHTQQAAQPLPPPPQVNAEQQQQQLLLRQHHLAEEEAKQLRKQQQEAADEERAEQRCRRAATLRSRYLKDLSDDELPVQAISKDAAPKWEEVEACGITVVLPLALCKLADLSSVLNMHTWNSILSEEQRASLQELLPKVSTSQTTILENLFAGEVFHFNNPVHQFTRDLRNGFLAPEVQRYRKQYRLLKFKCYIHSMKEYNANLISKILLYRSSLGIPNNLTDTALLPTTHNEDTGSSSGGEDGEIEEEFHKKHKRHHQHLSGYIRKRGTSYIPAFVLFTTLRALFFSQGLSVTLETLTQRLFLRYALGFLAHPPSITITPGSHFQPAVRYDSDTGYWQWLEKATPDSRFPFNDTRRYQPQMTKEKEEQLQSLEQLFWFALSRNMFNEDKSELKISSSRMSKSGPTIEATPGDVVQEFRRQEAERYRIPEQAFQYNLPLVKSVVAPLKRVAGNPSLKPREHFMLKSNRPSFVNILPLVRDAAARLPGGVGTRPDVAMLLSDSQFVVENIQKTQINTIVSGALDRLHAERDPCVRFDPDQKLWVYLHRHRTLQDFTKF
ncbi:Nuclear factor kappa-B-binding protein [Pelomyxa schiedti]|nr:Nuclear factor kappa-B-binding protein [Pelomyxa schiedti]